MQRLNIAQVRLLNRINGTLEAPRVKDQQRWKYSGGQITRARSTSINDRYYTDPKEAGAGEPESQGQPTGSKETKGMPRRKQESNFFITINPNRKFPKQLEQMASQRFHRTLERLRNYDVFVRCLAFGPKDRHYANDNPKDVIDVNGVDVEYNVEIGEQMGRMHGHVIIYITHFSQIQIAVREMQEEFRTIFNEGLDESSPLYLTSMPYLHVRRLPQTNFSNIMLQYIRKGMSA